MILYFVIFSILAYLLGSIPSAVWIGETYHNIDVREHGSKNAGATNTFRVLGKKAGIVVLLMDVIKGIIAVTLPNFTIYYSQLANDEVIQLKLLAGFFVFLGHLLPVFAQFRGGKGVATSLGIIIGLYPYAAVICLIAFLIVFIVSNYVSLGAIFASLIYPFVIIFLFQEKSLYLIVFSIVMSLVVIFSHRKNIVRLISGTENKMNLFKK